MIRRRTLFLCAVVLLAAFPGTALAQKSVAEVLGRPAAAEGQPKSYLEELFLYGHLARTTAGQRRPRRTRSRSRSTSRGNT